MHVRRSGSAVEALAPAKLNLFLEVRSRRADGYHEIESLMVPVALWDTLTFVAAPTDQISLVCRSACAARSSRVTGASHGTNLCFDALPPADDNLVVRAVRMLQSLVGHRGGARLRLIKRIPVAAGLGGGSSDAAAALVAANLGWGLGLSNEQLSAVAGQLGSDVPFFLASGPAICRGRGERVTPLAPRSVLHCVVAAPPEGLSTAEVYAACRPSKSPRTLASLADALRSGRTKLVGRLLYNGLQVAAAKCSPWIARLGDEFSRLDFLGHQMSGSGTSYFGVCEHARHARRLASRLQQRGIGSAFAVAATC